MCLGNTLRFVRGTHKKVYIYTQLYVCCFEDKKGCVAVTHFIIRLAPRATRWTKSRATIGYPSGQDGAILPAQDYPLYPASKMHQKPCNKSFIDQVCSVKMAGYWPRSFFASLWTSTSSRSINTQKKNLANIQPSWPHTWSITHTYIYYLTQLSGSFSQSMLQRNLSQAIHPTRSKIWLCVYLMIRMANFYLNPWIQASLPQREILMLI